MTFSNLTHTLQHIAITALFLSTATSCIITSTPQVVTSGTSSTGDDSFGDTDTDTDTGTGTDSSGGESSCKAVGANAAAGTDWAIQCGAPDPCDKAHVAPCTALSIDSAGPVIVGLECTDPDTGSFELTLTIEISQTGTLDLNIGDEVTLTEKRYQYWELETGHTLKLVDAKGDIIVAAAEATRYGGSSGMSDWDEEILFVTTTPLGSGITPFACDGDPMRSILHFKRGDTEVSVPSGGEGVLDSDMRWLISVEEAVRFGDSIDDGTIDFVVMRVKT